MTMHSFLFLLDVACKLLYTYSDALDAAAALPPSSIADTWGKLMREVMPEQARNFRDPAIISSR